MHLNSLLEISAAISLNPPPLSSVIDLHPNFSILHSNLVSFGPDVDFLIVISILISILISIPIPQSVSSGIML
jgi:hypothetical protein